MQESSSAGGSKGALQQHWEKIGLAAAVLACVAVLGWAFNAGESPEVRSLKTAINRVNDTAKGGQTGEGWAPPAATVPAPNDKVVDTSLANAWGQSVRTEYSAKALAVADAVKGAILFIPTPRLEVGDPAVEGIDLTWSADVTEKVGARVKVDVLGWTVERKKAGGKWEVVADRLEFKDPKDPKAKPLYEGLKWKDTALEPKTEYTYRVSAIGNTADPAYLKAKPENRDPGKPSNEVTVRSVGIWRITFANLKAKDDDANTPGQAYITIEKFDIVAGPVKISKIQNEGEKIGWWPDGGTEPTSMHSTFSAKLGKQTKVDFNTGGVLKKVILGREVEYTYKQCKMKSTASGTECEGVETKKERHKVNEVQFTDDEAKPQVFRVNVTAPKADSLCEAHGGERKPVESPEARKERRAAEAKKLAEEADALWNTKRDGDLKKKDRAAAKAKYRDLLSDYGDLDEVEKRKAEIEGKLKSD